MKRAIEGAREQKRLNEAREAGVPWKKWGPYLSERQWGTVREDYSDNGDAWDYFTHDQARSRAYRWGEDGLGGHLRRQAAAVLRARAVERARPDPQGAAVRPHQQRGQPRRGREGVLLLPRQHADPLVHEVPLQVPAARVPLRGPGRDQPAALAARSSSTNCSTPASSTTTATSTSFVEYAKAGPEDMLVRVTVHNRGPEAARLHLLPTLWFRNTWSWGDGRAQAGRCARPDRAVIVAVAPRAGRVPAALRRRRRSCCSPRTRRTRSGSGASRTRRRTSRTRSTRTSSRASATR